ncbi:MAG: TetR/AcrR family transcriptional regulator [Phycisphaerales bacterium]
MAIRKQISRREKLSCSRIARQAIAIIDRDGTEALTMRALSSELNVEPMSLYSHFKNKNDLLAEVAATLLSDITLAEPAAPPRKRLVVLAEQLRKLGHRHPNAFALIILNPHRLESALRITEAALDAYVQAGLSGRAAVQAQRVLIGFVRGYTMWEIGGFAIGCRPGPDKPLRDRVVGDLRALGEENFPNVYRLADSLTHFAPDAEFQTGVNLILDATMPAMRAAAPTPRKRRPALAR